MTVPRREVHELDVRLTKAFIRERRAELRGREEVELRRGTSDRVRVRVKSRAEFDLAYELVRDAVAANVPTAEPGLPPIGAELERRRRFH
jgi:hypothetical protein